MLILAQARCSSPNTLSFMDMGVYTMDLPMAAAAAGPNLSFISYRLIKLVLNDLGLRMMWDTSVWWHIWDNRAGPELWPSLQPCPHGYHQTAQSEPLQLSPTSAGPPEGETDPSLCPKYSPTMPSVSASSGLRCNSVSVHQRNYFLPDFPSQAPPPHAGTWVLL